ncbi:MAG: hypothetical protein HY908_23105 [Myxococcales bacterium]|nr:hypothetical protein [Myxococcales bacterium]
MQVLALLMLGGACLTLAMSLRLDVGAWGLDVIGPVGTTALVLGAIATYPARGYASGLGRAGIRNVSRDAERWAVAFWYVGLVTAVGGLVLALADSSGTTGRSLVRLRVVLSVLAVVNGWTVAVASASARRRREMTRRR